MPKGPHGRKGPAEVIGSAVSIAKIATAEAQKTRLVQAAESANRKAGENVYPRNTNAAPRKEIAHSASSARWES